MIRYSCTDCQRKLLIKDDLAGQKSTCPCGASFVVPSVSAQPATTQPKSASTQAVKATASAHAQPASDSSPPLLIACSKCDRQLRAPASAAGKAVRCVCGSLVLVPKPGEAQRGSTVVSVVDNANKGDWLSELPPPPQIQAAASDRGAEFWYVDADPEELTPPPSSTALPDARQVSHEYIRNAEKEIREQRRRGQGAAAGSLGVAQGTLIFVGILTIALNSFLYFNSENEVQQVMNSGDVAMSQEALLRFVRIFYGSFIAVGVVLMMLGALIYQFPLFCPLAGLIIYILAMIISAVIDPFSLVKGVIIKVLVVIALVKAVNDGAYYRD